MSPEVYWRPGCPYCAALRRDLRRRGIAATWRNIWTDQQARTYVRSVNAGNETVPTVRFGDQSLTNPSGAEVAALLGVEDKPAVRSRARMWRWASWLPTIALVTASELTARHGAGPLPYALETAALAAWWFSRPLRR